MINLNPCRKRIIFLLEETLEVAAVSFQMLEEIEEYGTYTRPDDELEEVSIDVPSDEQLGRLVREAWPGVSIAWMRVVYGCDMLIRNCCNPDADTLEWKPEIAERIQDLIGE